MTFKRPTLKVALDEGVPNAVGDVFKRSGHRVIFLNKTIPRGTPDAIVCAFAELNRAILVATDGDMREIARGHGVGKARYKTLSLIKLSCRETTAAQRVESAMTLIEHEWHFSEKDKERRIFIEISESLIKTNR